MRAVVCRGLEGPQGLVVEERSPPPLGPGEVRLSMRAAGVNFPDLLMTRGLYQLRPPLPFVPGLEGAGEVVECGPGVEGWRPGQRAIVRLRPGTFAEEVVAPAARLFPAPAGFDDAEAAAFSVGHRTAWHALVERGRLRPGETLLVHGAAGGVGLAAVELGARLGARVIATAGEDAKLAVARAKGAAEAINYRRDDFRQAVLALTDGQGADVIYDPVGGEVFRQSLRCIAWGGRLLTVGFASGEIAAAPANTLLLKGASLVGVRVGEFGRRDPAAERRTLETLNRMAEAGQLRPHVSHRLPLARAAEALMLLETRQVVGKAVLTMT
jgi:NADPH2:quinone reductase